MSEDLRILLAGLPIGATGLELPDDKELLCRLGWGNVKCCAHGWLVFAMFWSLELISWPDLLLGSLCAHILQTYVKASADV